MAIKINKGVKELVAEAERVITTIATDEAIRRYEEDDLDSIFVDIRDVRELERDGMVPGAVHVPRGMLEFWFDPESPYHKEVLADESKTYILYCAAASRSALACKSLQEMGFQNIVHFAQGYNGWKSAGGPVGKRPKRNK